MVAAGSGATVGITLWVVADGRYEPKNFPQFVIQPSELVWDFSTSLSNYTTLQQSKEAALDDGAWQIESSLSISPLSIESAVLSDTSATGGYAAIPASDAGAPDGGGVAGESIDDVRRDDLATVFAAGPQTTRITRLRADLSQAALANDLVLQAASDQTTLSNIYQVAKSVNGPVCPPFDPSSCNCFMDSTDDGGFGDDTGDDAGAGGANADHGGSLRPHSSGCAVGPAGQRGSDVDVSLVGLMGLVGIAFARVLRKTSKKKD
jgi:hypothetical protein